MADLNLLISQLITADELSEGLDSEEILLLEELRAAIKDATVCAFRLRLSRDLAAAAAAGRRLDGN